MQEHNARIANIPGAYGKILPGAMMNEATSEDLAPVTAPTIPVVDSSGGRDGPIVAYVEVDRYCPKCAYNLRTQPVRRDGPTELLVARCPECGSFDAVANAMTATKPWLSRLAILGLLLWVLILLSSIFGLSLAQSAVTFATIEGFTTWQQVQVPSPMAGGTRPSYEHIVRSDYLTNGYKLIMGLAIFGSSALAFLLIAMLVVACHHWPRTVFACFAVVQTFLVSAFVWEIWKYDFPALFVWSQKYIIGFGIVRLVGALAAVWGGRPLARLTIRIFLPPRIRSTLAFLWLADGLEPPRRKTPTEETEVPAAGA